jgi:hypothetical protein
MIRIRVEKWVDEALTLEKCPEELKRAVRSEKTRLNTFIDSLTQSLEQAESINFKRKVFVKEKTYQEFVYSMVTWFVAGIEKEAKRRYESDLARLAREAEISKFKEFDEVLAGKQVGEFAEAGVVTSEKIDKEREKALDQKINT